MLTFPAILILAAIALVGVLRTKLFGTPLVDRLTPAPAFLGEKLEGVTNCVFLLNHYALSKAAAEAALLAKYF